jgi:hypothetical protein
VTRPTGDLRWYTVAALVRDAVNAAVSPALDRASVVPGAIAWDNPDCGALYVTVLRNFYTNMFPSPMEQPLGNCNPGQDAAEIIMHITRCSPQPDGTQNLAPYATALDAAAQQLAQDASTALAALRSLLCGMEEAGDIVNYMIGETMPVGPSGGVIGLELRVAVQLNG